MAAQVYGINHVGIETDDVAAKAGKARIGHSCAAAPRDLY